MEDVFWIIFSVFFIIASVIGFLTLVDFIVGKVKQFLKNRSRD